MANKRRFALIGSIVGKVDQTDSPAAGDVLYYDGTDDRWEFVNLTSLFVGIDAETLDGLDSTDFAQLAQAQTITGVWTYSTAPVLGYDIDLSGTALDSTIFGLLKVTGGSAGDANWASVELLADFNGADAATSYTEVSDNAQAATFYGTAQLDTAQQKAGTASLLLDGNSDYVTFPYQASFHIGTSDFTCECFVRFNTTPAGAGASMTLFGQYGTGGNRSWHLYFIGSDELRLQYSSNGSSATTVSTTSMGTLTANTWYHVALVRESGVLKIFFDGVLQTGYSTTWTTNLYNSTEPFHIGASPNNASIQYLDGWIDELRFTNGVPRYSSNFTPPTPPYASADVASNIELGDASYDLDIVSPTTFSGALTIPEASVTAHEAALTILESQITDGSLLARVADTETVSGAWTFTNAVGPTISGSYPHLRIHETDVALDEKNWIVDANAGQLRISTATDAAPGTGVYFPLMFSRSGGGTTVDYMTWRASTTVRVAGGAALRIYDGGGTDYADFSHDGTNFSTSFTNTTSWRISGSTRVSLRGGTRLRIYDSGNTDDITLYHNGTNFITDFVNTSNWVISTITALDLSGRIYTRSTGSHLTIYDTDDADTADFSLLERNSGNVNIYHYDAGTTTFTLVLRGVREGKTSIYYNGTEKVAAGSTGLELPNATTGATATAGAATLPSKPVGFVTVVISGTSRKIPYYAT